MAEEAQEAGKKPAAKAVKKSVKKAPKAKRSTGAKKAPAKKVATKKAPKKAAAKKATAKAATTTRLPRETRDAFVEKFYAEGGKGVAKFCEREGIKAFNFNNWKKTYDESHGIERRPGRAAGTEVVSEPVASKTAKKTARASATANPGDLIPLYIDGRKVVEVESRHFIIALQALSQK